MMTANMSGTRCATTIHEPSSWLRTAAARRVRQIESMHLDLTYGVLIAPLGSSGPPGSRADSECDRCRCLVLPNGRLHLIAYSVAPRIILCTGLCGRCAAKEGGAA